MAGQIMVVVVVAFFVRAITFVFVVVVGVVVVTVGLDSRSGGGSDRSIRTSTGSRGSGSRCPGGRGRSSRSSGTSTSTACGGGSTASTSICSCGATACESVFIELTRVKLVIVARVQVHRFIVTGLQLVVEVPSVKVLVVIKVTNGKGRLLGCCKPSQGTAIAEVVWMRLVSHLARLNRKTHSVGA